jgi:cytochrome d ubiquinol oxidase subunit I
MSVELARWQFGLAASFHFLFVPLTLGLTWILLAMELTYVITGKEVYKDMTKFWGKLLGINFALGVLTGLTMAFSFGMNWSYYVQYVGDIFGTPLAIEGFLAFMLESTFLGLFFFGWDKLSKKQHLLSTACLAVGSSLSALLILVANGFMQHPVGAALNLGTMRMETTNLFALFLNPMAQVGFLHTVLAGYLTAAVFVLGISGYYLLRGRDLAFAKRSFAIAAGFGLICSVMVAYAGDTNGLIVAKTQPSKLAAIEADWVTTKAPAFNVLVIPSWKEKKNLFALQIPDLLGLIITHSLNTPVPGINNILATNKTRVENGMLAYGLMQKIRSGDHSAALVKQFDKYKNDLGYGMLLERYTKNVTKATPAEIQKATDSTIPTVWSLFYAFRIMVCFGLLMILMFLLALFFVLRKTFWKKRWLLRWALLSLPLPWICVICGWFVTEHGRQPWTVFGVLPTSLSASSLSTHDLVFSLITFMTFFIVLTVLELCLMTKFARLGPSALHLGRYHFEKKDKLEGGQ